MSKGASPGGDRATRASTEPASRLGHSASVPSACRNCAGEQWVCENHQDLPWESSGHADNCGAGAPCPVCNRDMACAPYVPWWQSMGSAPKDGTEILICGGTCMEDWPPDPRPFSGVAIARYDSMSSGDDHPWEGEKQAHDEYRPGNRRLEAEQKRGILSGHREPRIDR